MVVEKNLDYYKMKQDLIEKKEAVMISDLN